MTQAGYAMDEIAVATGPALADKLRDAVGRHALAGLAIRAAGALGIKDEEMETKALYEQAMRDGRFVLRLKAPNEESKRSAARLPRQTGAKNMSYVGRFTIETLDGPAAPAT